MPITYSRVFLLLAFVLFVLAALVGGGVISMSGSGWLVPGGLASFVLSFLVP